MKKIQAKPKRDLSYKISIAFIIAVAVGSLIKIIVG